ncbi:hypothetical protein QYF36_009580 [Acer negundo]|nr:hypothetical protein QYF36_009580 [Acer negundo]
MEVVRPLKVLVFHLRICDYVDGGALEKGAWVLSIASLEVEFTLIRMSEEKSELPDVLPYDALGSAILDEGVYSLVEFTLIWTSYEKLEPLDVLPYDAPNFIVLDYEVYSPVEFTSTRTPEEK